MAGHAEWLQVTLGESDRRDVLNDTRIDETDVDQAERLQELMRTLTGELRVRSADSEADVFVRDACLRLKAMTCLHRHLTRSVPRSGVELTEFLAPVRKDVALSIATVVNVRAPGVTVPRGICQQIAVIVTEFALNAAHGARDGRAAILTVDADPTPDGDLILTIGNDCGGLRTDFEIGAPDGFGMEMVRSMVDRLGGTFDVIDQEATVVRIVLPLSPPPPDQAKNNTYSAFPIP